MKKIILATALCSIFFVFADAQQKTKSNEALRVTASGFKLQAENIVFQGRECSPSSESKRISTGSKGVIKIGEDIYYEGHRYWRNSRGEGLVFENYADKTCRVFSISGLAKAAGWKYAKPNNEVPDSTNELFRVGKTLWMGSNGVGAAVYDLERKTWSRYDLKSNVIPGDHLIINYADDDYVFVTRGEFPGAMLHVYSVKQNKWLGIKSVPGKQFMEYGFTTDRVQIPVDHSIYAKAKYVPIDWTFMGLTATLIDDGKTYLFEKSFGDNKTVFKIDKLQLERVFMK